MPRRGSTVHICDVHQSTQHVATIVWTGRNAWMNLDKTYVWRIHRVFWLIVVLLQICASLKYCVLEYSHYNVQNSIRTNLPQDIISKRTLSLVSILRCRQNRCKILICQHHVLRICVKSKQGKSLCNCNICWWILEYCA